MADGNSSPVLTLDAAVIGAGVAGLYQVYQLRERGFNVKGFDTASGVGGTWYWNRYPGAKFDSESYIYQYLFDEKLYKDWSWSERFPGQPEIERWMNYVADRLDLRKDFQFNTTIKSAHFNEATNRWLVTTDSGQKIDTRYLISCTGMLSAPLANVFPGQERFKGRIFHTSRWPKEDIDFSGKRVGVVGNGATGIQVIQTIAPKIDKNFQGFGRFVTSSTGEYYFRTIRPGPYPWRNYVNSWRPAHIHFSLFGNAFAQRLITQMYFEGDPLIKVCPIIKTIPDEEAINRLIAPLDLNASVPDDTMAYRFDMVLRGRRSTLFENRLEGN